ncbi:hypothetical protein DFH08DRAFT_807260 [Mycena albidolilacea]|uniref:Uncharacterized protein n=1 Tax=Mycena albidolilacea TaxID=1033008 RepID=A0AAD7A5F9_9AGAR|nr:hypothetical protein DFH08DRAFT_807260 [Mycena albidolilacea]
MKRAKSADLEAPEFDRAVQVTPPGRAPKELDEDEAFQSSGSEPETSFGRTDLNHLMRAGQNKAKKLGRLLVFNSQGVWCTCIYIFDMRGRETNPIRKSTVARDCSARGEGCLQERARWRAGQTRSLARLYRSRGIDEGRGKREAGRERERAERRSTKEAEKGGEGRWEGRSARRKEAGGKKGRSEGKGKNAPGFVPPQKARETPPFASGSRAEPGQTRTRTRIATRDSLHAGIALARNALPASARPRTHASPRPSRPIVPRRLPPSCTVAAAEEEGKTLPLTTPDPDSPSPPLPRACLAFGGRPICTVDMRVIIMSRRTVTKRKRKENQHDTVGEQGKGEIEGSKAGAEKQSSRGGEAARTVYAHRRPALVPALAAPGGRRALVESVDAPKALLGCCHCWCCARAGCHRTVYGLDRSGATAKDIGGLLLLLWLSKERHGGSKKDAMSADASLASETNNR